eukprot:Gregarina_sp_Poly_1__7734@NODE_436_length_8449_cov_138_152470_g356_i0_p6_GENE_NODE_436_length_8449_cov_138_152470_g356_i0NODE_436_length_8449_cov_138_152470_g356_i0_p6_ORF_typecomplete_len171_score38_76Histone/PF00125_24/1_3e18Histone/PF00125_24/1e02CBFD_NFYB_HMF/PF00808_23/0_0061Histone_H2A_C/PF16211_5/0_016Herpes_LMP1/PF05297_11/0_034CENPB_dimeris/PF09026_10/2_3PBP1_TM/PF14812_6/3_6e03PBP1_TM/PF14812_6/1_6FAM176/PF14851_6/7_4e03FAM176/PF14851_6/20_NODE_436_length_8449_cov_138_152470_g356_i0320
MSGGGKSPATKSSVSSKVKSKSRSEKAGLIFPVGRIERNLKYGRFAKRIGAGAPIFMAAVLEYLTAEVLELASNIAKKHGRQRIIPRFVQLAVRADEELSQFLGNVIIAAGGAFSENAYPSSTPKSGSSKKKKATKKSQNSDEEEDQDADDDEDNVSEDAGGDHGNSQEY